MCEEVLGMETGKGEVAYAYDGLVSDNKEISSEVENTLTTDCFLNDFSSDQIGALKERAKAKYHKPCLLATLSLSSSPSFTANSSASLNISSSDNCSFRTCAKKGELLTLTSCEDVGYKMQVKPVSGILHTKKRIVLLNPKHYAVIFFSSSTSRTSNSAIFSITGSLASSESNLNSTASNRESIASNLESTLASAASNFVMVSLLRLAISFSTASMRMSTLLSKLAIPFSTASMRTSTLLSTLSIFASRAFISPVISLSLGRSSLSIQPGIFSDIEGYLSHEYIKHFLSKNFFAAQKPLLKIRLRSFAAQKPLLNFWKKFYQQTFQKSLTKNAAQRFAERTCAKKGNFSTLTSTSCEDARRKKEKPNMPLAKKFDTWCKSMRGLRTEGKREVVKEKENKRRGVRCVVSDA